MTGVRPFAAAAALHPPGVRRRPFSAPDEVDRLVRKAYECCAATRDLHEALDAPRLRLRHQNEAAAPSAFMRRVDLHNIAVLIVRHRLPPGPDRPRRAESQQ